MIGFDFNYRIVRLISEREITSLQEVYLQRSVGSFAIILQIILAMVLIFE